MHAGYWYSLCVQTINAQIGRAVCVSDGESRKRWIDSVLAEKAEVGVRAGWFIIGDRGNNCATLEEHLQKHQLLSAQLGCRTTVGFQIGVEVSHGGQEDNRIELPAIDEDAIRLRPRRGVCFVFMSDPNTICAADLLVVQRRFFFTGILESHAATAHISVLSMSEVS